MRKIKLIGLVMLLASGFSAMTQAALVDITLTPSDCVTSGVGANCWTTSTNSNLSPADIEAITGASDLESLYKENVGDGFDTGPFAASYTTTFNNAPLDPADVLIQLDSGGTAIDCGVCFLVIKDGNQDPSNYIFDLSLAGMINSISATGFWPNQGAISHIEIVGNLSPVPVPAAFWLFGTALIGFIGFSRRTKV